MRCGFFYALICYRADLSPGWVIAATWQFAVVATRLVLMFCGKKCRIKSRFCLIRIYGGVCLVDLADMETFNLKAVLLGGIPVVMASLWYPIGNQLIWEAKNGKHNNVPQVKSDLLNNAFNKVFLLCLWLLTR